jgi:hypothetical protein
VASYFVLVLVLVARLTPDKDVLPPERTQNGPRR